MNNLLIYSTRLTVANRVLSDAQMPKTARSTLTSAYQLKTRVETGNSEIGVQDSRTVLQLVASGWVQLLLTSRAAVQGSKWSFTKRKLMIIIQPHPLAN